MAPGKRRSATHKHPAMIPGARHAMPGDRLMTAEEFFHLPDGGMQHELLDGVLIEMAPTGARHGLVMGNISYLLNLFVRPGGLGVVMSGDPGILLRRGPDRVRGPDVCFAARERLPEGALPETFLDLVPDLIVEIVPPGDTRREVEQKIQEWLDAGARLVWVVDPTRRSVTVRAPDFTRVCGENDLLDGGEGLPGFAVRVSEVFA